MCLFLDCLLSLNFKMRIENGKSFLKMRFENGNWKREPKIRFENGNWGLGLRNGYPQFNIKLWITIKDIIIKL